MRDDYDEGEQSQGFENEGGNFGRGDAITYAPFLGSYPPPPLPCQCPANPPLIMKDNIPYDVYTYIHNMLLRMIIHNYIIDMLYIMDGGRPVLGVI